jgi:NADH-quinone oxidoreductase subunit N
MTFITISLSIIDFREKRNKILTTFTGKVLVVLYSYYLLLLGVCYKESFVFSNFLVQYTSYVLFIKILMHIALIICILSSLGYVNKERIINYEYYLLLALAAIGMIVVISANDLMVLYVGIEIQSLALYILAAIKIYSNFSTEAGLKYFIIGAFSSGLLLLGCSFIYGATGTTHFISIMMVLNNPQDIENFKSLIFGLILILTSLLFKLGAAPFHM